MAFNQGQRPRALLWNLGYSVPFAEVKMAEFSLSVAAAAALLAATGEIAAENLTAFRAGVTACPFVNSVSTQIQSLFPLNCQRLRNWPWHANHTPYPFCVAVYGVPVISTTSTFPPEMLQTW
jgi:hypothetical protein